MKKYFNFLFATALSVGFLVSFFPILEFSLVKTPEPVFIWNEQPFRPVGVNYYPRTHPWEGTWTDFNRTELEQELQLVKDLGGNCIRTFIQWRLVEPEPWIWNMTIVNRIIEFFEVASDLDIAIMFSFFDFSSPSWSFAAVDEMYINKSLIEHEIAQLELIIPLINETKAAFMWDLRNEPTSSRISPEDFTIWVENMTKTIRNLGDSHYIVVGGGYGNFEDPSPYAHLVDAVCMHFYRASNEPQRRREFETYLQMFKNTGKPVIVQEFGWPNYDIVTEEMQAHYYNMLFQLFDKHKIAGVMPWCLWDYGPNFWSESQANFGLLRFDQTWKPSAYAFRDYAMGNRQNTFNFNLWEGLY